MCGIVGYTGPREASHVLSAGLHRLEYRGYDSAGVALFAAGQTQLTVVKTAGKVAELDRCLQEALPAAGPAAFTLGIGHTRWATHGPPTQANAHPHLSGSGDVAVVHNGIIENFADLKRRLEQAGCRFVSQTDSEVIAHLIEECYEGDLRDAVVAAVGKLQGTYGFAAISRRHPGLIVAARRGSPMVVGVGEKESLVASDVSAIVNYTRQVVYLDDGDIAAITPGHVDIMTAGRTPAPRELTRIDWDVGRIEKGGYAHFMLKEIHEQPEALTNTLRGRLLESEGTVKLGGIRMEPRDLAAVDRVVLAACGTSLYAGMVAKYFFEDIAGLPADVEQAAEFRYRNPILERNTCLIAISQSGETADTLAAVREAQRRGANVLGVCNVVGSSIAREAGRGVYLHAGPEIGVASTKAFSCQIAALAMVAIALGRARRLSATAGAALVRELARLPEVVRGVLQREGEIAAVAARHAQAANCFFIGRGYMYPAALEGALKLKEISYIHAEGYHAAELKHGPIALLEPGVPVVAAVPDIPGKSKTLGNIQECRARHAPVIAIATDGDAEVDGLCDDTIRIPPCAEFLSPVPVVVAEQLFAYHVALLRGCPIDQPRNLAKSVTVE